MSQLCEQYSYPHAAHDERIDTAIVCSHGAGVLSQLLSNYQEKLRDRSSGVAELLSSPIVEQIGFDAFWDAAFGRAHRCLQTESIDPVDTLVLAAVRLTQFINEEIAWDAKLSMPISFVWGNILFPRTRSIRIIKNTKQTQFWLEDQSEPHLIAANGSINRYDDKRSSILLPKLDDQLLLVPHSAIWDDIIVEDDFHSIFSFPDLSPAIQSEFEAGINLLQQTNSPYLPWIKRVLRKILVCECTSSRTRSSTWAEAPGTILVSRTSNRFEIAEMLIHEASHQYFNIASRLGPVVVDCSEEFYSPAVKRNRPLSKVLLGYHAFGNMYLFYKHMVECGVDRTGYCVQMFNRLRGEISTFETPLRNTQNLSEIGRALFEPLTNSIARG